jgi:hypothetical protein
MKKSVFWLLTGIVLAGIGCTNNTYSSLRDKEDKLIDNYISRNQLVILEEEPAEDYVWGEKEYYHVSGYDKLYFHLTRRGPATDSETGKDMTILRNDIVVVRYKQFQLYENADTLSYWTTLDQAHPYEFYYGITSGTSDGMTSICESIGWQKAVQLMKYPGSECEVIVPSKQGFSNDETSVTPYVYIIRIVQVKQ